MGMNGECSLTSWIVDLTSRTPPYDIRLVQALQGQGCAVQLWAAGSHSDDFDSISVPRRGIDWAVQVPMINKSVFKRLKAVEYVCNLLVLAIQVWRTPPDVLHLQWLPMLEVFPFLERSFLKMCNRREIELVYTVHDVLPLDAGAKHRRTFRQVYQLADGLICHTDATRIQLVEEFNVDPAKVYVIPHGPLLDGVANISKDEARQRLELIPSVPLVLQFGVVRPYKGTDILLRAWKKVEESLPSALLVIAGSGEASLTAELNCLINRLDLKMVKTDFRFLPEDELRDWIAAADVLVYPYRNITQSGALFAGMNAEKPIIATKVGGLAETLDDGHTGCLIEPERPEVLSHALINLLTMSPERRDGMGRAAKRALNEQFSWDVIAQKTLDCYRSVQRGK